MRLRFHNPIFFIAAVALICFVCLTCWYISYAYVKMRTDLKKNGRLQIEENWGENFLVALVDEGRA